MSDPEGKSHAAPRGFRPPAFVAVAIGYMGCLVLDQQHWWRLKPDYAFGWLAPLFVGYVLHERWPQITACLSPSKSAPTVSPGMALATVSAWLALVAGGLCFALGALYRAGAGHSQPGSLALAAGFALLLPALGFLSAPRRGQVEVEGRPVTAPWRLAGLLVFPALVWLVTAPLVSAVENALSLYLLRKVVTVVFFCFDLCGFPLIREGNVLVLPRGQVGVAEACSGIRSLTGCIFAGSFLAAVLLPRLWQKLLLLVLALLLAFATNLLRSLFLTGWAYAYGSEAIEGGLHDATGYAVLGLTTVLLFCLLPLLRPATWERWLWPVAPVQLSHSKG